MQPNSVNVSYEIAVELNGIDLFLPLELQNGRVLSTVCVPIILLPLRALSLSAVVACEPVLLVIQRCVANANERTNSIQILAMQRNFGRRYATEECKFG